MRQLGAHSAASATVESGRAAAAELLERTGRIVRGGDLPDGVIPRSKEGRGTKIAVVFEFQERNLVGSGRGLVRLIRKALLAGIRPAERCWRADPSPHTGRRLR